VTEVINKINDDNEVLLTVGGDHSIATGTIHGLLGKYPDLKLIWVDAHGDIINASKSPYPGYHGMPLSHVLGVNDGIIPGF
jgi:arginase